MPGAHELLDVSSGCRGYRQDETVAVTVSADNVRQMVDTNRPRFLQSAMRCAGPAPQAHGHCDDVTVRAALHCKAPDFSRGFADLLPYAQRILHPLIHNCGHQQDVLVLGLGGGAIPTYLKESCPGTHVLAVDNNSDVVRAARDFFAYRGEALVEDLHHALADLSNKRPQSFDAVVTDVGHNIKLTRQDLQNVLKLLKPSGLVVENLSNPAYAADQLMLYKEFLGGAVSEEVSAGNHILFGRSNAAPPTIIAWSGLTRLFRLDDAGDEMMEVEAGEGRDGLFVAVLRSSADVGHQLELLVYTAIRKRKRLRVAAAVLELQTPSQDSVSFYDDTGIYWALQLEKTEESVPLARLLLAAKAASSGEVAMVELKCADTEAAPCSLRLAAVSHRSLLQSETQATVPSTSSLPREQLESADAWWGSGASRALEGQLAGSVALLAVPPGSQGSLRSSDDSVLLLEVVAEGLAEVDRPVEINQARGKAHFVASLSPAAPAKARGVTFARPNACRLLALLSLACVTPVDKFRPSCIQCRTWASCMAERAQRGRGVEAAVLASEAALSRDDIIMSLDAYKHFDEMSPELSVGLLEHEFTNASTRSGLSMNAKGGDANTDGCSLVVLLIVLPSMRLGASKLRTLWFRWQWFARTGNRQGCAGFRCRGCIAAARFRKRAGGVRSCCCAWCLDLLGLAYSAGLKGNLKKLAAVCRILWKALVQGGVPALSFTDSAKVFGEDFDVGEVGFTSAMAHPVGAAIDINGAQPRAQLGGIMGEQEYRFTISGADWDGRVIRVLANVVCTGEPEDTKRLSVKERMAKLAAASLPPGAIGMMPLAEGDVDEKVSSSGRPKEAKDPVLPGPGVCPSPPRPSHPGPLPVNQSGLQNGHPSAEIIRQYWSAVQESGTAPYAYLGALPFVPGLTRMPIAPSALHSTHGAAAIAEMAKGFNAGPVPPSMPTGPTGPALTLEVPLSSVSMGEFMASMRDLVRAEATPEGWQAERQKLERRVIGDIATIGCNN
ncbi:hypothetical protein AK812_SmicGene21873 [Symbiodinium microadriaticum]|uniref:Methyltransferase domain-containing protein n=1 Tax=Symbiodinium microadriaticum TaxID=2951 RepID=A0A1Q9DL91_SYMMI|nr:hypothetical protein AK812_SmicGene21873 [Symbiodinium microadriaticum]